MATAAATCCFTALTATTGTSRYSLTSQRLFVATLRRHSHLTAPISESSQNAETHAAINPNRRSRTSKKPLPSSPRKASAQFRKKPLVGSFLGGQKMRYISHMQMPGVVGQDDPNGINLLPSNPLVCRKMGTKEAIMCLM